MGKFMSLMLDEVEESSGGGKHDWLGDGGERVTQVYSQVYSLVTH